MPIIKRLNKFQGLRDVDVFINEKGETSEFFNIPDSRLTIAMDGINALDYTVYGTMGLEYTWNNMASVRMGTHLGHDTAGMSFGFGLDYNRIVLDYAFVNYDVLDVTHQFGIGLGF